MWVLEKYYHVSKNDIINYVKHILNTPNIHIDDKDILMDAIGIYELENMDFIDTYNAASMSAKGIKLIYSHDKHYDKIADIKRIEP